MRTLLLACTLLGAMLLGFQPSTASAAPIAATGSASEILSGQSLVEQVKSRGYYCKWHKKCGWKRVCWWKHGYRYCDWKRRCTRWCEKKWHHKRKHGIYLKIY